MLLLLLQSYATGVVEVRASGGLSPGQTSDNQTPIFLSEDDSYDYGIAQPEDYGI